MKTTIDIADDLLLRGKRLASELNITFRTLIEEGLEYVIKRRSDPDSYKFRTVTFKGKGLNPEFEDSSWNTVRDAIYKGRGS